MMQDEAALPAALRWGGALAIVLALHGAAAWMLLRSGFPPMAMPAALEAVMLDLAPDLPPVQPAAPPTPIPPLPAPEPPPPEPPLVEPAPPPPVAAETVLPVLPPPRLPAPRPQPRPKPRIVERPVERQPAPSAADATPRPVAPAPVTVATPSWRNELLGRLQRAKRYPDLARSHGDQGVVTVTFTMDRGGRVLSVSLVRSSGSALLDEEGVALVRRAEPLPSLPEEMGGSTITLTVPISFALR